MGPRLEFVPCGQIPQDEEEEELSSAQLKDRHDVFFHSQGQGDLPYCTCRERLYGSQKVSDVGLPIGLFTRIQNMGRPQEKPNTGS